MSLARFAAFFSQTSNEEPVSQPPKENPKQFDVTLSGSSSGIRRVYARNNVLSIFMRNDFFGDMTMNYGIDEDRITSCVDDFYFGHRNHSVHDTWHESEADFEIRHTHLVTRFNRAFTPTDVKCIFNEIVDAEAFFKFDLKQISDPSLELYNECIYTNTTTKFLARKDEEYIIKEFTAAYFRNTKPTTNEDKNLTANGTSCAVDIQKTLLVTAALTYLFANYLPWNKKEKHDLTESDRCSLNKMKSKLEQFRQQLAKIKKDPRARDPQYGLNKDKYDYVIANIPELQEAIKIIKTDSKMSQSQFSELQTKINRIDEYLTDLANFKKRQNPVKGGLFDGFKNFTSSMMTKDTEVKANKISYS